jgi:hypothetical protein
LAAASDHRQSLTGLPITGTAPLDATTVDNCGYSTDSGGCYPVTHTRLTYPLTAGWGIDTVFTVTTQHDTRYLTGLLRLQAPTPCRSTVEADVRLTADDRVVVQTTLTGTRNRHTIHYLNIGAAHDLRLTATLLDPASQCRPDLILDASYLHSLNPWLRWATHDEYGPHP